MVNGARARLADEQLHGVIGANNALGEAGRTPTKSMGFGTPVDRPQDVFLRRTTKQGVKERWEPHSAATLISPGRVRRGPGTLDSPASEPVR
ncbi:hypothetical protein GMOD_00007281 [Pyrenophora seminiperda CCB06]|uniref:Uncharacterized protein n=1 Tax=Pyrenophora seminiperda CCB06 TaxID=1302712 RepID=A0A3M7MD07_9PLEO|nr:hypothetical protein GMOD_00007281 [Pyrenophora seminiperda CCB06]